MTTPKEADRAAELARQLNELGIKADPGLTGGVVFWATADQAAMFLAALVPASAQTEHDLAVTSEFARLADAVRSEFSRSAAALAHAGDVRRQRMPAARPRGCGTAHAGECPHEQLKGTAP